MSTYPKYLLIDIGTGNVRVAITDTAGQVVALASDDVLYQTDPAYTNALFFEPQQLWRQILTLLTSVITPEYAKDIVAISSSSQREGIVAIDKNGHSLIGMPNIDHRGREFEHLLQDKDRVYNLTGRYPTSLFSAFKMYGLAQKKPTIYEQVATFLSISEWALFQLSGSKVYEHSQASETLLYDVGKREWSQELCTLFGIDTEDLPPLAYAGTIVGNITDNFASQFGLSPTTKVIVGGADTQLAIESTLPSSDDIIVVSGTTTPITQIIEHYVTDSQQRTWTNSHTSVNKYILETNAGVTGLNYQRFKSLFYPAESYAAMEDEMRKVMQSEPQCYAALGSLICDEKQPLTRGGFTFNTPLSHTLTRGHFTFALVWDLACSIYENYKALQEITNHHKSYVWACGGGMQSDVLRQLLANLFGKEIRVRNNYRQATVAGCAFICNRALNPTDHHNESDFSSVFPDPQLATSQWYQTWKNNRSALKNSTVCP